MTKIAMAKKCSYCRNYCSVGSNREETVVLLVMLMGLTSCVYGMRFLLFIYVKDILR